MVRRKFILVSLMICLTVFVGACAKEGTDSLDKRNAEKPGQQSGAETTDAGLVGFIKKQKLVNFQSVTIGNAFESYKHMTKKEWKLEPLKSGHFTVDFIGWFDPGTLSDKDSKDGVIGRGLDVKFVINSDGSFYLFMISMIEAKSDGKEYRHQLNDSAGILDSIYANKKISL